MSDTQQLIVGLGIYILIGYSFMRGQLWLAIKSLEHQPNAQLEAIIAMTQNNIFIRIFMTALWPIVIVCAFGNGLIDYLKHKKHSH